MGLFNNSGETKEEKKARRQAEAEAKQAEKDLAALRKFGMENLKILMILNLSKVFLMN